MIEETGWNCCVVEVASEVIRIHAALIIIILLLCCDLQRL